MRTTAAEFNACLGIGTPEESSNSTRGLAKLSAAKALPSKPASVMATWIVARKRAGCWVRIINFLAFLLPSEVKCLNFASLMDITAISALAKIALKKIKIICSINASVISQCHLHSHYHYTYFQYKFNVLLKRLEISS